MSTASPTSQSLRAAWQEFSASMVRGFHVYASWLVGISWRRFFVLSLLLLIGGGILKEVPPFTWTVSEREEVREVTGSQARRRAAEARQARREAEKPEAYEISIDERGVRITPRPPAGAASGASAPQGSASDAADGAIISIGKDGIKVTPRRPAPAASAASAAEAPASLPSAYVKLPPGADSEDVKAAIEEARDNLKEEIAETIRAANEAAAEAAAAENRRVRIVTTQLGDVLMNLVLLFILSSSVIKFTYKGRIQAEVKAAQATETAESESLKRQVVEARMAAMQAQVEPHFLFNTLASIDHLIETDPPRASTMQKNLIALLRASMPSMREVNPGSGGQVRDLGRELAVIRPYLEILKVRMEERLATEIRVSDGLLSAEFPPMMLQSLVENAIKHGLEPKAEGGRLTVSAEIVHGKLAVTVADTGLGFGKAATAGTGIGLSNIRERLQLLYGSRAGLKVAENPGGGTAVTITVPYQSTSPEGATA
jgi:hypothetical protein